MRSSYHSTPFRDGDGVARGAGGLPTRPVLTSARIGRALSLAALIVLSGCASPQANTSTPPASPSPTAATRPPAEGSALPEPTEDARTEVVAAYERYLEATARAMESGDGDLPELLDAATGQALAAAQARVVALTSQDRTARGRFLPSIEDVQTDADAATIRDCFRADIIEHDADAGEQVADRDGARLNATVELSRGTGDGWVVTSFREGDTCVPTELADEIEARYVAFWHAVADAGNPPNPDHPQLTEVAAGEQLHGLRARLRHFENKGYEVRDASISHPTVTLVSHRDTVARVRDCRELDPDGGVYDTSTGELVDGGARQGQHALWAVRLELIDGGWKVVDADLAEEDSACAAPS